MKVKPPNTPASGVVDNYGNNLAIILSRTGMNTDRPPDIRSAQSFNGLGPSARSAVEPFLAMDVLAEAARLENAGRDIIHMELGQPGAPAPRPVLEAARSALTHGRLQYTPALGIAPLRERIATHYREEYGVSVSPDRVMITTGSSAGFTLSFLGAFDAGGRIAMAAPGYPAYANIIHALGLETVIIPVSPESRWAITAEAVSAVHRKTPFDGLLIASPANPTGTMTSPAELKALADWCAQQGVRLISDEIYHRLVYEGRAQTALAFTDDAVIVNSFSKYYCMTGWRIGWMIVPDVLVRPFERLAQSVYISAPDLSQRAAVAAFQDTGELEAVRAGYARNRAFLLKSLPELGFEDVPPVDGAFYVYANVTRFSNDSSQFANAMLHDAGVAATPGLDFDRQRGHRYIRFSFAGSEESIRQGIARLGDWLA